MFSVDQGSGIVTLTSTLDYETEKFYQLEIMATVSVIYLFWMNTEKH